MKKVLIADDELLVRIGLKSTVPWEENGFVVVGEAKNGKEAIELFEEYDPDILLTDIRMPIMNGLELIQTLRASKSTLKAVILTHYDDFSYAKEAIKLGASEYILKSDLSPEALLIVLKKLSNEIDNSDINSHRIKDSKGIGTVVVNNNKEVFLKKIISRGFKTKDELIRFIKSNALEFKYSSFIISAIKLCINDIKDTRYGDDKELLKKSIENITNHIFDENHISHTTFFDENNITYLFNIDSILGEQSIKQKISDLINLLKRNIKQFLDIDLAAGISNIGNSVNEVPDLFNRACIAQKHCFFEPSGISFYKDDMILKNDSCPQVNLEILKGYVKTLDMENLDRYIGSIFDELYTIREVDNVKNVFIDLLSQCKIIANELNLKSEPALSETKFSYKNFDKLYSFEAIKKYIYDILHELIYRPNENKLNGYSFTINKCISFLKNNYKKNITLSDAAEYVEISKSYLSLLFKQETGINFSSFLTNYRIEKSKKLLKESNLKMYEIAEQVGFDNPYYFSKVFKEITGISCKEYKRMGSETIE